MKEPRIAFLLVLLAGAASAQQPGSTSYPPERKADAPTFMNAEVVRIDRASNRITFRSESRETTLIVEGEALTAIGTLHAGDKVVVGYRIVKDADGREIRYVTSVTPASPTSGEPGGRRVPATLVAGSSVRARVLSYDKGRRRVTVIDESGGLRTLGVGRGVSGLDVLQPGANVSFNLGAAGTGVNITGVQPAGGQVVGGVVAGPTSPLPNPVPNVPGPTPVQAAVLPPAVAQQPLSADEVGAMRAQGEADLDASAVALSAAANALDAVWAGFKSRCLLGFTAERVTSGREWYLLAQGRILTPTDDACRALYTDLTNRAQGFMQQLEIVEDAARKADVLPVRVREVFDRHRLR